MPEEWDIEINEAQNGKEALVHYQNGCAEMMFLDLITKPIMTTHANCFFGDMDGELVTLMSRCGCELIVNDLQQSTGDTQHVVSLEDSTLDKVLTHLDELM
ncbi:hypothetical protein VIOR103205_12905 [Vibrio ordalii]